MNNEEVQLLNSWVNSPIKFICDVWGLVPQKKGEPFEKGKMMTWQQHEILLVIEKGLRGEAPRRISIVTGHGIGKSATLSWLIHWFLFTRDNSQIGCTAPTSAQMYDVLWKELMTWHQKLPDAHFGGKPLKEYFEYSTTHYRIKEKPETWWARARTARKEDPEAFAGLHAESLMLLADEASGVPDEIYRVGEGALTNKDILVVLVGNGTRLEGFFYDTHNRDKDQWQILSFSSKESPIVEPGFPERIQAKYGLDSDEYRFMVAGLFPKKGGVLDGGYLPLLSEGELRCGPDLGRFNNPKLGVDPSGEGSNKSAFVVRDPFKAKIAALEGKSNPKKGAEMTLTLMDHYKVRPGDVTLDNFGEGANWGQEIALAAGQRVNAINVGEKADNPERFLNKRSENYWRAREWMLAGGTLVGSPEQWKELLTIYYKRNLSGKIKLMTKEDMANHGWESPDIADAFSMTFNKEGPGGGGLRSVEQVSDSELDRIAKVY